VPRSGSAEVTAESRISEIQQEDRKKHGKEWNQNQDKKDQHQSTQRSDPHLEEDQVADIVRDGRTAPGGRLERIVKDKQVEKDKLENMDIHEFVEYCCQELSKIPQEERLMTAYSALAARDNLASWEQEELERLHEILQQRQLRRPLEEQRQFEERLEESLLRAKIILQRHQQQRQ
jgi:hypothetical protein